MSTLNPFSATPEVLHRGGGSHPGRLEDPKRQPAVVAEQQLHPPPFDLVRIRRQHESVTAGPWSPGAQD